MSHQHKFEMHTHVDSCHAYQWVGTCSCGAAIRTYDERDVEDDPYSVVWMEDIGGEKPCERCAELLAGAKPLHEQEVIEPEGVK